MDIQKNFECTTLGVFPNLVDTEGSNSLKFNRYVKAFFSY